MAKTFQYDVFLSHSSVDKDAVRELARRLKGNGVRVWFDEWIIQPGDIISLAIEQGLEKSRVLVLAVSEAALKSEWVTLERHTALFRDPTNKRRRFVPLRLDNAEMPEMLKLYAYIDWRAKSQAEYGRLLEISRARAPETASTDEEHYDDAAQTGRRRREAVPRELPPFAEKFFGRRAEFNRLRERLQAGKNSAVVGAAGLGKTALAAEAVSAVVGATQDSLARSPFPDGVVFLDLYAMHAASDEAWNSLANKLAGPDFLEKSPSRDRAIEACRRRHALIIVEGAEVADGEAGRAKLAELLEVLSQENRRLVLTRDRRQASAAASIELKEALNPDDAGALLDSLAKDRLTSKVRQQVLELLEGHPLALTWAGNLLALGYDDPGRLVDDWKEARLPDLTDPADAERTLKWLFERSVRGLDDTAKRALAAAGLLAHAPFPAAAVEAALGDEHETSTARSALQSLTLRSVLRHVQDDLWQFSHVLGYRFARREKGSDPTLRGALGSWLRGHFERLLAGPAERITVVRALEHLAALLRADDDQRLWEGLANPSLYEIHDRTKDLGRLSDVKSLLTAVAGWMEILPPNRAIEPQWERERSVLLNRQGDVLTEQGDLAGALAACREAFAVRRRLAESDPSNAAWQRDLSVSQNKLGDVLSAQGDLAGALAAFREALAVRRRLAESDPSNATWQRDLSISREKLGDVLSEQGDLVGALATYRDSLAVRQRLAESDPSNATWQRDLSVSQNKLGDVLRAQGDLAGALAAFRDGMGVIRRLAESDASNATWQHDLSVSHSNVGDVLRAKGDLGGALAAYQEDLAITRQLAESDPSNASWQRDLFYSLNRIAEIADQQGDRNEASTLAEESLNIAERLAALDPTNVTWQKDVAVSRALVARLRQQGESK